jgi:hypothetical protein
VLALPDWLIFRRDSAIDAETNATLDVYDAISDLALAEGVHQVV